MILQTTTSQHLVLTKSLNDFRTRQRLFNLTGTTTINSTKVSFYSSDTQIVATVDNNYRVIGTIYFTNISVQPTMTNIITESVSVDWETNHEFINSLYAILHARFSLIVSTNIQSNIQQKIWKILSANPLYNITILDGNNFRTKTDTITLDQPTIDYNIANNIPATVETGVKYITSNVLYNGSNLDDSDIWSIYPNVTLLDTKLALSAVG